MFINRFLNINFEDQKAVGQYIKTDKKNVNQESYI